MTRAWVPIPGYEGRYDVSDDGRVRSWVRRGGPTPYLLAAWPDEDGYLRVGLTPRGQKVKFLHVHQLVALAFHGPRPDGLQTRHLNGVNTDNWPANLAYGTQAENENDKIRHGTQDNGRSRITHCPHDHPYDEANTFHGKRGGRWCRTCKRESERLRRARLRGVQT